MTDELLDRKEAAAFCKISDRTLDRQTGLPRIKLTERRIVYRRSDLENWISARVETRSAA